MKKFLYAPFTLVFSFLLLFILLISSFELVCYRTPGYYEKEFQKYEVLTEMRRNAGAEMSMESLSFVMKQTLRYLRGARENLLVETEINGVTQEFYLENEKSHMADVRELFLLCITLRTMAMLSCLAIAGLLIVLEHGRAFYYLAGGYLAACLLTLLLSLGLGVLAALDFSRYFAIFHEIFFRQGNWLFDPHVSLMINMLPEGFFQDTALRILLCFFAASGAPLLLSLLLRKKALRWYYTGV